jgi:hypothetical protein
MSTLARFLYEAAKNFEKFVKFQNQNACQNLKHIANNFLSWFYPIVSDIKKISVSARLNIPVQGRKYIEKSPSVHHA